MPFRAIHAAALGQTPAPPCPGSGFENRAGILQRAADRCDPTELLHQLQIALLLRADGPVGRLDLDGDELADPLAHHGCCDLDAAQADQVAASLAEPETHQPALPVHQCTGVVPPEPGGVAPAGQADPLLDLVFSCGAGAPRCRSLVSAPGNVWKTCQSLSVAVAPQGISANLQAKSGISSGFPTNLLTCA